jgi:hypothetical protein
LLVVRVKVPSRRASDTRSFHTLVDGDAIIGAFLRANPGGLLSLQAVLGHERLETTRLYLEGATLEEAAAPSPASTCNASGGRARDAIDSPRPERQGACSGRERWRRRESNPRPRSRVGGFSKLSLCFGLAGRHRTGW